MRQLSLHGNPDDIEAHMTEKPTEAYLAAYFFGRDGRRTERRFDDVGIEIKAYGEGFVDGRRTARGAEDWRKARARAQPRAPLARSAQHPKSASLGPWRVYRP
jgi:hypothetical protein